MQSYTVSGSLVSAPLSLLCPLSRLWSLAVSSARPQPSHSEPPHPLNIRVVTDTFQRKRH